MIRLRGRKQLAQHVIITRPWCGDQWTRSINMFVCLFVFEPVLSNLRNTPTQLSEYSDRWYLKGYRLSIKGSDFGLVQMCVRTDILDQHCTVDTYTRIRQTHRALLYEIKLYKYNSKRRPLDCNFTNAARFVWQTSAPKLYSVVVNIPCWSLRAIMLPNFSNLYRPGTEYENQW